MRKNSAIPEREPQNKPWVQGVKAFTYVVSYFGYAAHVYLTAPKISSSWIVLTGLFALPLVPFAVCNLQNAFTRLADLSGCISRFFESLDKSFRRMAHFIGLLI